MMSIEAYIHTNTCIHTSHIYTYIHIYPHIERYGDRWRGSLLVMSYIPFPHDFSFALPTFLGS